MLIKESVDKSTDFIPDGMTAFERNVKRIGDCLLAFIALVVFSPLFLICYIAVRREEGRSGLAVSAIRFISISSAACVWTQRSSAPPFTREALIPV